MPLALHGTIKAPEAAAARQTGCLPPVELSKVARWDVITFQILCMMHGMDHPGSPDHPEICRYRLMDEKKIPDHAPCSSSWPPSWLPPPRPLILDSFLLLRVHIMENMILVQNYGVNNSIIIMRMGRRTAATKRRCLLFTRCCWTQKTSKKQKERNEQQSSRRRRRWWAPPRFVRIFVLNDSSKREHTSPVFLGTNFWRTCSFQLMTALRYHSTKTSNNGYIVYSQSSYQSIKSITNQ